ncbi:MAG: cyclophilin-like family protein [Candidatus Hodarchaeota archaeon]
MSFIQFLVEFSIVGQSKIGRAIFKRSLAPRTTALIRYQLRNPIQSRVILREGELSIPFKIGRAGPENAKHEVRRGEVAYWTQSNTLKIFLENKKTDYPVNIVGSIDLETISFFENLRIGKSIRLEMVQPSIDEADYL